MMAEVVLCGPHRKWQEINKADDIIFMECFMKGIVPCHWAAAYIWHVNVWPRCLDLMHRLMCSVLMFVLVQIIYECIWQANEGKKLQLTEF